VIVSPIDAGHPGIAMLYNDTSIGLSSSVPPGYQQMVPCGTSITSCSFTTTRILSSHIQGVRVVGGVLTIIAADDPVPLLIPQYVAMPTTQVSHYGLRVGATTRIIDGFNPSFGNSEHPAKEQLFSAQVRTEDLDYTTLNSAKAWFNTRQSQTVALIMQSLYDN
jgi:hypothetical protein